MVSRHSVIFSSFRYLLILFYLFFIYLLFVFLLTDVCSYIVMCPLTSLQRFLQVHITDYTVTLFSRADGTLSSIIVGP